MVIKMPVQILAADWLWKVLNGNSQWKYSVPNFTFGWCFKSADMLFYKAVKFVIFYNLGIELI